VYEFDQVVDASEAEPSLPTAFHLAQNHPNPFNPRTTISFRLRERALATLEIYNVFGQRVRTLFNESKSAGEYRVEWDGTDDNGSVVASGVFLYRLSVGDFVEVKKMTFLK